MEDTLPYQMLADVVLSLHVAIVVFVVGGLVLVIIGNVRAWRWVNALWFRVAHLALIAIVVAEAWLGAACPVTSLEMWLRAKAHATIHSESFIEHWLQLILYYEAPGWVFTVVYSLFGLVVAATWWYFPPGYNQRTSPPEQQEAVMLCPKCHSTMERVTIGRTDVDRCVSCKGLWFDMSEYQDLLKYAKEIDVGGKDVREKTIPGRRINCPVCTNTPMVRMADERHPHIWFESCPSCQGCYLDAGEFRDMGEHSFAEALKNFFTRER